MRIESDDKESFLTLFVREQEKNYLPSRRLAVKAELDGFRGSDDKIWVTDAECKKFLAQAEELERTRQGTAVLESMSPGEFRLELRVVDRAGHAELAIVLSILKAGGRKTQHLGIHGDFELDPSGLPLIVKSLRMLLE
jgi:hypothetical protein